eukprot:scaffold23746_cov44-Phaeocystis_antarctica.AAC.3
MEYHTYTPLQTFTHPYTPLQPLTAPYNPSQAIEYMEAPTILAPSDVVTEVPRPVGCGHRDRLTPCVFAPCVFAPRSVRLRAAGASLFVQGGAALDPQAARGAAGPTGRRLRRARLPPLPARGRRHTGRDARAGDRLVARRCGAAAAARGQGVMGRADC